MKKKYLVERERFQLIRFVGAKLTLLLLLELDNLLQNSKLKLLGQVVLIQKLKFSLLSSHHFPQVVLIREKKLKFGTVRISYLDASLWVVVVLSVAVLRV